MTKFVALLDRAVLDVTGPDAEEFLQGLVTNNLDKLKDRDALFAALLTPQGKINYEFFIIPKQQGFYLEMAKGGLDEIFKKLSLYKLRADVEIANLSESHMVFWLAGPGELSCAEALIFYVPFASRYPRRTTAGAVAVPKIEAPTGKTQSTQAAFGQILDSLARGNSAIADRIVTTSPDVTVSTNLGSWVNRRGIFDRRDRGDAFRDEKVVSAQQWRMSQEGQHIELGIAENNLFILLAALGLSHETFGSRLIPIGTLYDPFIQRGLDALNYACYQGARFMLVATPSGITLAPEGGAHQSVGTPLIGMAQDGLAAFEPAFADELAVLMGWSFDYLQRDGSQNATRSWLRDAEGGSVYFRLSTRPIDQLDRSVQNDHAQAIIDGGYWLKKPADGADMAIVYTGAIAPEAIAAWEAVAEDVPGAGLLAVTSADRLNAGWLAAQRARQRGRPGRGGAAPSDLSHVENLLRPLSPGAGLVTVVDGHPATLSWLGAVNGHRVHSLGVEHFGQSGDLPDLYRTHRIDTDAILDACATVSLDCLQPARFDRPIDRPIDRQAGS